MNIPRFRTLVALSVVVSMPLLGLSGIASPRRPRARWRGARRTGQAAQGRLRRCPAAAVHRTGTAPIVVTVSPNPLVETGSPRSRPSSRWRRPRRSPEIW